MSKRREDSVPAKEDAMPLAKKNTHNNDNNNVEPTTDEEAQSHLDAKAPPAELQREINAYRRCTACRTRDALHAEAGRIVEILSPMTLDTSTFFPAPEFFGAAFSDCQHIIREMRNPPFYFGSHAAMASTDAIQQLIVKCGAIEQRRALEVKEPLLEGHCGADAVRLIAEAMPQQSIDVVHVVFSYIDVDELVSQPAADRMFRLYNNHLFRYLQSQRDKLQALEVDVRIPRCLADIERIAALHGMYSVLVRANLLANDGRFMKHMMEHAGEMSDGIYALNGSLACRHTATQAREIRDAMAHYSSVVRAEQERLRGLGFQVCAVAKLAKLV